MRVASALVEVNLRGAGALLTLNRPYALNALDEEGYFYFVDREEGIIKRAGRKTLPRMSVGKIQKHLLRGSKPGGRASARA